MQYVQLILAGVLLALLALTTFEKGRRLATSIVRLGGWLFVVISLVVSMWWHVAPAMFPTVASQQITPILNHLRTNVNGYAVAESFVGSFAMSVIALIAAWLTYEGFWRGVLACHRSDRRQKQSTPPKRSTTVKPYRPTVRDLL